MYLRSRNIYLRAVFSVSFDTLGTDTINKNGENLYLRYRYKSHVSFATLYLRYSPFPPCRGDTGEVSGDNSEN